MCTLFSRREGRDTMRFIYSLSLHVWAHTECERVLHRDLRSVFTNLKGTLMWLSLMHKKHVVFRFFHNFLQLQEICIPAHWTALFPQMFLYSTLLHSAFCHHSAYTNHSWDKKKNQGWGVLWHFIGLLIFLSHISPPDFLSDVWNSCSSFWRSIVCDKGFCLLSSTSLLVSTDFFYNNVGLLFYSSRLLFVFNERKALHHNFWLKRSIHAYSSSMKQVYGRDWIKNFSDG